MKSGNILPNDSDDYMCIFAKRIEEVRVKSGKNQKDFCKFIGVKTRTYRGWVNGEYIGDSKGNVKTKRHMPNLVILNTICNQCDVSLDYLFGRTDFTSINNEMISKETGLDDESIRMLNKKNTTTSPENERWIETLNDIIHEPNVIYLISDIIYSKKLYGILEVNNTSDKEGLNDTEISQVFNDENDYKLISQTENGSMLLHTITDEIMNTAYWKELENLINNLKKNTSK